MGAVPVSVALVLGLLVLLLAVPVDVAFRFEGIEAFEGQMTIRWLFGLVRFRIRMPGVGEPRPEPQAAKARRTSDRRSGRAQALAVLRIATFRRRVYRLAADLFRALHPRGLRLKMRLGLGDPADTGRLWAFVGPLNVMAQSLCDACVQIEPEFMDPVLEFQAEGRLLLVPLQLLMLAIGFALSPSSIRAWRTFRGGHA